jgi:ATP-binding cassette subfamily C protein LapB
MLPFKSKSSKVYTHEAMTLTVAVRRICEAFGRSRSISTIKRAVSYPYEIFGPKEACFALAKLGFRSQVSDCSIKDIKEIVLPVIGFDKENNPFILLGCRQDGKFSVLRDNKAKVVEHVTAEEFQKTYSGYIISCLKLTDAERKDQNGHWFFGAFRKSRWLYFQVILASVVSNFLALTTSIFTMTVYDRIIPNSAIDSLIALSIGVIIALSFDFIIKTIRGKFIDNASKSADLEVSNTLFDRVLSLTPEEQSQKTGAMAGIIREFETLRDFFTSSTLVILVDLPFAFFFIYVISLIAGPMAYVPLAAVPLVVLVGLIIQPLLSRLTNSAQQTGMSKQSVLVETLSGIETVTATGSGHLMKNRYLEALIEQADTGVKSRNISQFLVNFSASVQQYAQVGAIFLGVYLIRDGVITQGALIAAVILGGRTLAPLSQLANALTRVNGALAAYKALNKLLANFNTDRISKQYISRQSLSGDIEFKNVTFGFEPTGSPLISNLSIKIPAGQKVAIVGKMGSGKSTVIKLIAGLLKPTAGSVLVDGIDVNQLEKDDLRSNIGIMLQDTWLFSGSIKENIQMGMLEFDDEHILNISQISGADDFISTNPSGYDFIIQERGVGLSGGQRQSINLARSLLHDPAIILLDEPTSAMDQAAEKKVVSNLNEFSTGKTMLMITHRNPIFAIVDRVLVFENGKIIADKTPKELGLTG